MRGICSKEERRTGKMRLVQSLLAAAFIFLMFLLLDRFHSHLMVASLGASAFIAFSFPHAGSSRPKVLVGGYLIGALWGTVCSLGLRLEPLVGAGPVKLYIPLCAVAVLLSMICMTYLDVEHPPSAALAIAVVTADAPLFMALAAVGCIVALSAVKQLLQARMVDL